MPSGFDPLTTPGKMTTNVGVVTGIIQAPFGDGVTRVPLGVTKGGSDFEAAQKWRAAEFDGRRHIAVGTEEVIDQGPSKMVFTTVEFSDKVWAAITPGATSDGTTTTPIDAGVALTEAQYIKEPWHELTLKDGTIIRHKFDYGIVVDSPNVNTKDKDEASMKVTIESRVDPTKPGYTTDAPDYVREIVPAA